MPVLKGNLKTVTSLPSTAAEVWVAADKRRRSVSGGVVLPEKARVPVENGKFTLAIEPGAAVLMVMHAGHRGEVIPLLVLDEHEDISESMLAADMADGHSESELANLVRRIEAVSAEALQIGADLQRYVDDAAREAGAAKSSAEAAFSSSQSAGSSASQASTSASTAERAASRAGASATSAGDAASRAASSASAADSSSRAAGSSATTAGEAATRAEAAAKTVDTAASTSKTAAGQAEAAAKRASDSESKAKASETNAKTSETNSKSSASAAAGSATSAKTSETNAGKSASAAKTSETAAGQSADRAEAAAKTVDGVVSDAKQHADKSKTEADRAEAAAINAASSKPSDGWSATDLSADVQSAISAVNDKADKQHTHVSADITDAVDASRPGPRHAGKLVKLNERGALSTSPIPENPNDAASKGYVDVIAQGLPSYEYVENTMVKAVGAMNSYVNTKMPVTAFPLYNYRWTWTRETQSMSMSLRVPTAIFGLGGVETVLSCDVPEKYRGTDIHGGNTLMYITVKHVDGFRENEVAARTRIVLYSSGSRWEIVNFVSVPAGRGVSGYEIKIVGSKFFDESTPSVQEEIIKTIANLLAVNVKYLKI